MTDNFFEEGRQQSMTSWGLRQMMKGAGYAAVFSIAIGFTLGAIYAVGLLLPEEARQTPDPMPRSGLEQPLAAPGHDLA